MDRIKCDTYQTIIYALQLFSKELAEEIKEAQRKQDNYEATRKSQLLVDIIVAIEDLRHVFINS